MDSLDPQYEVYLSFQSRFPNPFYLIEYFHSIEVLGLDRIVVVVAEVVVFAVDEGYPLWNVLFHPRDERFRIVLVVDVALWTVFKLNIWIVANHSNSIIDHFPKLCY